MTQATSVLRLRRLVECGGQPVRGGTLSWPAGIVTVDGAALDRQPTFGRDGVALRPEVLR
jgi:hypothetical protein